MYHMIQSTSEICGIQYLKEFIGRRIGLVQLEEYVSPSPWNCISHLLKDKQFKLDMRVLRLPAVASNYLLTILKANNVEQLSISAQSIDDPVNLLISISSLVGSMRLRQPIVDNIDSRNRHLFGVCDIDWASAILKMFSGKLHKLEIENNSYPYYLSRDDSEKLIR
ncbi:hypothetical protein PMAYCL1PPCAC_20152, partial [Pristionchus mayeri]